MGRGTARERVVHVQRDLNLHLCAGDKGVASSSSPFPRGLLTRLMVLVRKWSYSLGLYCLHSCVKMHLEFVKHCVELIAELCNIPIY